MLKFKNAQTLSRTDMKKLVGGTSTTSKGRLCPGDCIIGEDERYCRNGKTCQMAECEPGQDKFYAYRCL
jgi:hypothetical protein